MPVHNFEAWKRLVLSLAKRNKKSHLIPGNDCLFTCWEGNWTPERTIAIHCTIEAQRKRHGLNPDGSEPEEV